MLECRHEPGEVGLRGRMGAAVAVFAVCGWVLVAQQSAEGPYTAAQAAAGRTAYQTNCAACHAADLSGREGPQLAGANFITQWESRTAGELVAYLRATMPPGAGGALPDQAYVEIAAFI